MNDLLELALASHGGIARWNQINTIKVNASITGGIWYVKGKPDALKDVVITLDTHRQHLTMDYPGQNKHSIFEPSRVVLNYDAGRQILSRDDPASSCSD